MKIEKLTELIDQRSIDKVQIYRNPSNLSQWFAMIKTNDTETHVLVDNSEQPITQINLESLLSALKQAGLKSAEVLF
jgi:CTP:phosphocholine cytidylyltransferase-like protein